eukprot:204211-Chlamydomonas_euryale.AAC.1
MQTRHAATASTCGGIERSMGGGVVERARLAWTSRGCANFSGISRAHMRSCVCRRACAAYAHQPSLKP